MNEETGTHVLIPTLLVDDHIIFSDGLEKLLNDSGQFKVIGKFNNTNTFLKTINKDQNPQLLILDIEMPELNGLDLIKKIRPAYPSLRIVILSMHEESAYIREARQSGANGYLLKSIDSNSLISELFRIMSGANIFPEVSEKEKASSPLSEQETRILNYIAEGRSSKEIAQSLDLSPLTVQAHRRNILKKLNINNTAELIKIAISRGFIK